MNRNHHPHHSKNLSILIVDDDAHVLNSMRDFLTALYKVSVDCAESGSAALQMLKDTSYDAIISDYDMGGMNGITLVKKIRAAGNDIPFIIFTGKGREEIVIESYESGVDVYVQKGGDIRVQYADLMHKITAIVEKKRAERELRESEKHYRILAENISDVVWILDAETGYFKYISPSVERLRGYTVDEIITHPVYDAFIPEDLNYVNDIIWSRIDAFKAHPDEPIFYRDEIKQSCKDGSFVWTEVVTNIYRNDETGTIEIRGVTRDISDRKAVESQNLLHKQRLEQAQAVSHTGSWEFDLRTGAIWGSDEGFRIYGMVPPQDNQLPVDKIEACIPERDQVHQALVDLIEERNPYNLEFIIHPADGSPARIISSHAQLIKDESGVPVKVVGVIQDITTRKQAEEEIRRGEEKFRILFETMGQGITYHDPDGSIISGNPAAERILGLTLDQMQGRTSFDPRWKAIHKDGSDFPGETHPAMIAIQTGKEVHDVVMGVYHPEKEEYCWILIDAFPFFRPDERTLDQVIAVFTDITNITKVEKDLIQKENDLHLLFDTLKISEERFHSLFVYMKEGVVLHEIIYDENNNPADYKIIDANPALETHTGLSPDFVRSRLGSDLYQTTPAPYLDQYAQVAETGEAISFETYFEPMGKHFSISVFSPGKGFFATVFQDITIRKRRELEIRKINEELSLKNEELAASYEEIASSEEEIRSQMMEVLRTEEKIRKSERRLSLAQQVGKTGSFEMILNSEDIIGSDEFFRIYGIHNANQGIVPFEIFKSCTPEYDQVLAGFVRLIQQGGTYNQTLSIFPADGSLPRYIRMVAQLISSDEGVPMNVLGVIHDITEEHETEQNLKKTKEFLENLISHANCPIIVWNQFGRVTEFNHAFEIITGLRRDDILGEDLSLLFPGETKEMSLARIDEMMRHDRLVGVELPILNQAGQIRTVVWNSAHITDHTGVLQGVVAQGTDITEQKQLKIEKNAAIGQIKRNMAELAILNDGIRNPLTIMLSLVEGENPHFAEQIIHEIVRIDNTINQLDIRWMESEKILDFLRKHYQIDLDEQKQTL